MVSGAAHRNLVKISVFLHRKYLPRICRGAGGEYINTTGIIDTMIFEHPDRHSHWRFIVFGEGYEKIIMSVFIILCVSRIRGNK